MKIDTHLHLHKPYFEDKRTDTVVENITKNKIITWAVSCDIPSWEETLERSKLSEYIFPSFGVLPWYAHEYIDRFDEITKLCEQAIMLGEIGLDEVNVRDPTCIQHQLPMFEIFLREAEKNNKIMNCHFRGKDRESFDIVHSYKAKKIIFHHYTGDIDLIKDISDAGYYISIGRIYNKKKLLKIPDELLILEIDVLPRRDPSRLSSVILNEMLEKYAEVKNITSEELEAITQRNVMKLISDDHQLIDMVKLME